MAIWAKPCVDFIILFRTHTIQTGSPLPTFVYRQLNILNREQGCGQLTCLAG